MQEVSKELPMFQKLIKQLKLAVAGVFCLTSTSMVLAAEPVVGPAPTPIINGGMAGGPVMTQGTYVNPGPIVSQGTVVSPGYGAGGQGWANGHESHGWTGGHDANCDELFSNWYLTISGGWAHRERVDEVGTPGVF